ALTLGGLVAANSIGIKAANAGVGAAKGGMKGLGNWVVKRGGGGAAGVAARVTSRVPPPQPHPPGLRGILSRLSPIRAAQVAAQRATPALQKTAATAAKSPGLVKSVWEGTIKGSGLFKKKGSKGKKTIELTQENI